MRALVSIALVAACCAASVAGSTAHADSPSAAGRACGFAASTDPTGALANPDVHEGYVYSGPVLVADLPYVDTSTLVPTVTFDTTGNPASGQITCAVQVGGTGVYTDGDACQVMSDSDPVVVRLIPHACNYYASATDPVWLCTTWRLTDLNGDSETLYLDDSTGNFLTDPAAGHCALATTQGDQDLAEVLCFWVPEVCALGVGGPDVTFDPGKTATSL
jgi:hypothetical protein